jgi:hypothetical protein
MTYSAQRGEVEISRLHSVAICKEISERLAVGMKPEPSGMPPLLIMLMRRLRDKPLSPLPAYSRESWTPISRRDDKCVGRSELARYPCSKGAAMVDAVVLGRP